MAKADTKKSKDKPAPDPAAPPVGALAPAGAPTAGAPPAGAPPAGAPVQRINVRTQYIKDFSFENPGAPSSLAESAGTPKIQVNVDVEARPMGKNFYEVSLRVTANASREEGTVFVVELVYAGLFALENFPKDRLEVVCLVECPRILFPFARRVIADTTREGGFPPLFLDPIDFGRLYRQNRGGGAAATKRAAASEG